MSKWLLIRKQWPFPLYFDICHGNAYYFKWRNVYLINLWRMEYNSCLFQLSCSLIKNLKPFYSCLLHWEKIWCIFPKGRNCDLGVVLESHKSLYKLTHDTYENLKSSLTHVQTPFKNSSDFWIVCEAISGNYPGGIRAPIC